MMYALYSFQPFQFVVIDLNGVRGRTFSVVHRAKGQWRRWRWRLGQRCRDVGAEMCSYRRQRAPEKHPEVQVESGAAVQKGGHLDGVGARVSVLPCQGNGDLSCGESVIERQTLGTSCKYESETEINPSSMNRKNKRQCNQNTHPRKNSEAATSTAGPKITATRQK